MPQHIVLQSIEPGRVQVSLLQHIGLVASPVVDIGDYVCKGQLLAEEPRGSQLVGRRIHAPISGTVIAMEEQLLASGQTVPSVVIEREAAEGVPETEQPAQSLDWRQKDCAAILQGIAEAGVVGLGGATFPTAGKLGGLVGGGCDYLLLNAAESEPYLHSDAALMAAWPGDLIGGIDILAAALQPRYIVIGLEQNKSWLLPKLQRAIAAYRQSGDGAGLPPLRLARLRVRYPQGAESQLVAAISGREVPAGGRPQDVGCLVVNVATAKAVCDAMRGRPLTARAVTVSGAAVAQPRVFWAPIGTPVLLLLQLCGGLRQPPVRMICGGPLMGSSFYDLAQQQVTKGSNAFLFLSQDEVATKTERPCIQCNACLQVCPMGLEPAAMYKQVLADKLAAAENMGLSSCIACGACAAVCPSQIPLAQGFRLGQQRQAAEPQT